jgi:1-deoxy-D-xylulose-5-phosphate reductoisomerase
VKTLVILGSTGSIGTQALDVIRHVPGVELTGLSGFSNMALLAEQANEFTPPYLAVPSDEKRTELMGMLHYSPTVFVGDDGLIELVTVPMAILLVAIVGTAALSPL